VRETISWSGVLRVVLVIWAGAVVPVATVLLCVAASWTGRLFALALLTAALLPANVALAVHRRMRVWYWMVSLCLANLLGAGAVLLSVAPNGEMPPGSRVHRVTASVDGAVRRLASWNLLPEVDQLMLGFTVLPLADPLFTSRQASELKKWTRAIYDGIEADPDFRVLASSMPEAYDEVLGRPVRTGSVFVYVPANVEQGTRAPVLLFFHGSGGNLTAYTWLLSHVADRLQLVVVAPSHGLGNWNASATRMALGNALDAAGRLVDVDLDNLHVMGLSNGGMAVCQVAATTGVSFRSLIFLSPVFDPVSLDTRAFSDRTNGRPVLVLSGMDDDRVPARYVAEHVAKMRADGASVFEQTNPGANHFLFFSHRADVIRVVGDWLVTNGASEKSR
jgi:pimeloyl-ACP methyl ester carboxylesterase